MTRITTIKIRIIRINSCFGIVLILGYYIIPVPKGEILYGTVIIGAATMRHGIYFLPKGSPLHASGEKEEQTAVETAINL